MLVQGFKVQTRCEEGSLQPGKLCGEVVRCGSGRSQPDLTSAQGMPCREGSALALPHGRPQAAQYGRGPSLFSCRKLRTAQSGQALWDHMLR